MPNDPSGILPHREFLNGVENARFDAFRRAPQARVRDEAAFAEMQAHILRVYEGVDVVRSVTDAAGHVFDCIPLEHQPSLRANPHPVHTAPDIPAVQRTPGPVRPQEPRQLQDNACVCPPGTIAMRRITLEQLTRFTTLDEFLKKTPPASAQRLQERPNAPDPDSTKNHRYAYVRQSVANVGAHNYVALWSPTVNSPDQIFSLSQHWYTADLGPQHQSLEIGWQVYPEKYGHAHPVLFIFWTPDNYANGNYNLDAPAFVQTSSTWAIGGALAPVSVSGGAQLEIEITVYLFEGKWWLYVGGTRSQDALGYYPASLFGGGKLARGADQIVFGGETACRVGGWGEMGSGAFAGGGWPRSAYQRDIYYFASGSEARWAAPEAKGPSPECYTVDLSTAPDPWNVYFFFGGPGGTDC